MCRGTPVRKTAIDYEAIRQLADDLDRPVSTLLAQDKNNDPYAADVPYRRERAEWFAKIWSQFGYDDATRGIHVRRIHYRLISSAAPIPCYGGAPYANTEKCWRELVGAGRDARLLDLVPIEAFVDHRNEDVVVCLNEVAQDAELEVEEPLLLSDSLPIGRVHDYLPAAPEFNFTPAVADQRFHVEIWVEKSTVNDIILPLARQFGVNVVAATGDISLTHCHQLIERAIESGRPVRILYISDFDPRGLNMPVAAARKIEFLNRKRGLDLDIQVRPIALTHDQCIEFQLPRTPLKEVGKGNFEDRFGDGATELDALEALHPGTLRQIIVDEISRYYDDDLDERTGEVADEVNDDLAEIEARVVQQHEAELGEIEAEHSRLAAECNAELRSIAERYEDRFSAISERFNVIQRTIATELETAAPRLGGIEWPEPDDGDEDDDPLFDSTREYVEQIDRFKEHKGMPTARRVRGTAKKRRTQRLRAGKVRA